MLHEFTDFMKHVKEAFVLLTKIEDMGLGLFDPFLRVGLSFNCSIDFSRSNRSGDFIQPTCHP